MYDKVKYMGKTLKKWQEDFHNLYSLGELYQMMSVQTDFKALPYIPRKPLSASLLSEGYTLQLSTTRKVSK